MRLIRCGLAAATVAASASAIGLLLPATGWMPRSSDATQVRVVAASGISWSEGDSPQPPFPNTGPQASAPPCYSYGGPYCGWVGTYWGGCDREWGLSFGIKSPYRICPHDPRPSPSDTPGSSGSPSPSGTRSPSGTPSPSGTSASAGSSGPADQDAETFDDQ